MTSLGRPGQLPLKRSSQSGINTSRGSCKRNADNFVVVRGNRLNNIEQRVLDGSDVSAGKNNAWEYIAEESENGPVASANERSQSARHF